LSHTPHELHEEFPEYIDRIHALKISDAHFGRLMDEYNEANRAVHNAETNLAPTDEAHETAMRKTRMVLKDQIWRMLSEASA
jgi:uncharacterized protein YdcH (DUF465 family)